MLRVDSIWLATEPMDMRAAIPTAGLLAHVMIAKFADRMPLYRQESIVGPTARQSHDKP